jgi:taurine dioxygenase
MTALGVHPIAGALGAEISGVDLSRDPGEETVGAIRRAWLEHLVIFFRDQGLSPAQFLAFGRRFGEAIEYPFVKGLPDTPEVIPVLKQEHEQHNFGGIWHSDTSYLERPPMASMLIAREVPPAGGDTEFANMYLAYETLSEPMKAVAAGVKTWNVGDRKKLSQGDGMGSVRDGRYAGNEKMAAKVRDPGELQTESAHPLVRTHPETGRKALYIGSHTQTLHGFAPSEARPIVELLKTHAVHPEFTCRFRWEVGSMAIWDNRCTQHRALNDYHGWRRRMHRITIAGDAPF